MACTEVIGGGNIEPRALEEEMRTAYLDYAMSVIVGRALPDVRDGLKPVHRRVLFAMNELGLGPTRPRAKSSRIVGDVMGNFHPHGNAAIYDTLVRMAQDFSLRYPLIDPRATSARSTTTRPPPSGTPRRGSRASPTEMLARPRHGHGRLRAQLRRQTARNRWCCRHASRICSSTALRASRWGWPRTSRPTTCAR